MKVSLKLGAKGPLNREQARTCLVANACFPGSGSLLAGRRVGYAQMALMTLGFALSMAWFGLMLKIWIRTKSFPYPADWFDNGFPPEFWRAMFVGLAGIGLFAFAWIWSMLTGLFIMSEAKPSPPPLK